MIIVLKPEATAAHADAMLARISAAGLKPLHMPGAERVVLGALGDERVLAELDLEGHPMVESVKPILAPYKLVSRELHPHDTIVSIGGMAIGGRGFAVIAGPCAVETREQTRNTARAVKAAGASALRAGAYKPRTSPYGFAGHGREGLKILRASRRRDRPADRHRGDGHRRRRARRRTCRRAPDRRAQHAEFRAAPRGRQGRKAGAAQARHVGQDRGIAARRRISAGRGQRAR